MSETCECCQGIEVITPLEVANRPGLDTLAYRAGTHATFLASMKARLSSGEYPALAALATREPDDPALALLDAWATVADVLTFYQERIANEGFLRTASEGRSIFELARLVGYQPRPGVSASTYLAFTMEDGYEGVIPAATRAQSVPGPDERPQPFETSDDLEAHAAWNVLTPRLDRPQSDEQIATRRLYFKGIDTNLGPNDPLLVDLGVDPPHLFRVEAVHPDRDADRTLVTLQETPTDTQPGDVVDEDRLLEEAREQLRTALDTAHESRLEDADRDDSGFAADTNTLLEALSDYLSPRVSSATLDELLGGDEREESSLERLQQFLLRFQGLLAAAEAGEGVPEQVVETLRNVVESIGNVVDRLRAMRALRRLGTGTALATARSGVSSRPRGTSPRLPTLETDFPMLFGTPPARRSGALPDLARAFGDQRSTDAHDGPLIAPTVFRYSSKGTTVTASVTDTSLMAFRAMGPRRGEALSEALANMPSEPDGMKIYALRVTASPFGHNAPRPEYVRPRDDRQRDQQPWRLEHETDNVITLDASYDRILRNSWIVIRRPQRVAADSDNESTPAAGAQPILETMVRRANVVTERSRADYGITSARSTEIELNLPWLSSDDGSRVTDNFSVLRRTTVYAQSELLELADAPLEEPTKDGWRLKPIRGKTIELDSLQTGLEAGRWLIVSGERERLPGVHVSELVMLAGVEHRQNIALPGDRCVSTLVLARKLTYSYKRETLRVYANVVGATHGETHREVLGSGDGNETLQEFKLGRSPLTYLPAPTPVGAASTLTVYVNGVRWHEADRLADLRPTDRCYVTRTNDLEETTISFGDGEHGARLPSGIENVEAVYRAGLGREGNVEAGQISQLATRPLGLAGVTNPLLATGGADREGLGTARRNAPLAVTALDRLVSVQDYADFARSYAGIAKARATRLSSGSRSLVHLTIAGRDDVPVARDSELYRNLLQALRRWGDPRQLVRVERRELKMIALEARVRLLPDYQWAAVEATIRAALLEQFAFDRRELGQDVVLSEVTSSIQQVPGVAYVDVEIFGGVPEKLVREVSRRQLALGPAQIAERIRSLIEESLREGHPQRRIDVQPARLVNGVIRPAQLAFLPPETLILTEISP
jgi:predicted phage baseplate assembly protein